ncbi:MAG: oligosaccharide flippase family protein [Bacteroidales bacterium]|jgi:O-antigen/teichoic acid export membrane protein|nr:oligosaccharide flippase family protein [Bacteroidales bacterium]
MLSKLKSTFKQTIIYGIGNISSKLAGFILIPIYTKQLSVEDFGILSILEISSQILIAFLGLSIHQGLTRWYWDIKDEKKQKSLFFTLFAFVLVFSAILTSLLLIFKNDLSQLIFDSQQYADLVSLLLLSSALQLISQLVLNLMRLQSKATLFSATSVVRLIISMFFTVFFIINLKRGVAGVYEAQIISFIIFFIISFKYILKNFDFKINFKILKEVLVFSYPLAISAVAAVLLNVADRYSIRYISGFKDTGIYSLGFKISSIIKAIFMTSAQFAITPIIYKMVDDKNNIRFYSKLATYMTYGITLIALAVSIYGKELVYLLAKKEEYYVAFKIIPILSISLIIDQFRYNIAFGLNIAKKTSIISKIIVSISILNIFLNILLITYYSIYGAAIATLISRIIFCLAYYYYANKYYPVPYEITKIVKLILLATFFIFIALLVNNLYNYLLIIFIKFLIIAVFPITLYYLNFYEDVEIKAIIGFWRKWKDPINWKNNISKKN